MSARVCIFCGKPIPVPEHLAVDAGWSFSFISEPGRGRRWYGSCGCRDCNTFYDVAQALFDGGRNLPRSTERNIAARAEGE